MDAPKFRRRAAPKLQSLGVTTPFSRRRLSDNNAYAEAFFRTLKHASAWPAQGFATLEDADVGANIYARVQP